MIIIKVPYLENAPKYLHENADASTATSQEKAHFSKQRNGMFQSFANTLARGPMTRYQYV